MVLRIKEGAPHGRNLREVRTLGRDRIADRGRLPHKGNLDYIAPQVDPSTGTMEVRAIFDNKNLTLLPGLFVRVRIPVRQAEKDSIVRTWPSAQPTRRVRAGRRQGQHRRAAPGESRESTASSGDQIRAYRREWVVTNGMQRAIPESRSSPRRKRRRRPRWARRRPRHNDQTPVV